MKKKILCLLLAMVLVLSMVACGGDSKEGTSKENFASFMEVQENMQDMKDMSYKMDMKISTPKDNELNMNMSASGKEVKKAKDDIEMEMEYSMDATGLQGTNLEGIMYMKDSVTYMEMMGQKVKMDASEEMASLTNANTDNLLGLTEDIISDLKVTEDGSDTTYAFTLDANKAFDYFSKNAGNAGDLTAAADNITFKKMNVTIVANKDKLLKSLDLDFSMDIKDKEETVSIDYTLAMTDIKVNQGLKIDFPDLSEYQELSV